MGNITKVVDGVAVTDTDVSPPQDWTNVYDEIDGEVQPFFGTCSYTGEAMFLMQVGGRNFIFWNALDDSMYRVNGNSRLQKIVQGLDEAGLNAFELEEI
ncbi:uncharacterized protein B0J16DRAFT_386861 [Fusarium flagelliforme]|uniref:uncharacterized protein n=1 Tax=Fusarium flagelliforme TaxID=2675880 RepID=UPI001E8E37B7|nr:uncharacterized protein B0J16DRAFT_386861 [Fusarium flagelliforme]KAH7179040.1 hypothetical protein B0J16DRAFT_386861 [Fusarium flagelliforme]